MRFLPAAAIARRILVGRSLPGDELPGRRYLRGAVLGVALSLVPLVVVLVVADGMIEGITARYIETSTFHLQARPYFRQTPAELSARAAELATLPDISAAFPEAQGPAIAVAGSRSSGALIRAVDPAFLSDPGTARYLSAVEGKLALESPSSVLLGEALARNLGLHAGDSVSLVTARASPQSQAVFAPKVSVFHVAGIVSAGYRELDALWVFASLKAGSRILSPETTRPFIGIKTTKPFGDLSDLRRAASEALGSEWTVSTWPEAERNIWKSFATTKALLVLIMALVVAVAAINVSSALVMLVLERRKDIAILKSEGAPSSFVGLVFVLAGLTTGGLGTLLGLTLGSFVAWRVNDLIAAMEFLVNMASRIGSLLTGTVPAVKIKFLDPAYYLEHIPIRIDVSELVLVAIASLTLCFLASLLAARRAARLPPLEILRKV